MVTKIFRRDLIESNNIRFNPDLLGGQDLVFSKTCILYSRCVYLLNEAYWYHYRYNSDSRTNTYLPNSWEVFSASNKHWADILADYEGYDFSEQLKLHRLLGALTALSYEFKPGNPNGFRTRYRTIKEICNEMHTNEAFTLVDAKNLDLRRKITVWCIEQRWALYNAPMK